MNIQTIDETIKKSKGLCLYFSNKTCSVCHTVKPKLFKELSLNFPSIEILEVDLDLNKEISSQYQIFSIPSVMIYFESKLSIKKSRNFSISEIINEISRPYNILFKDS